MKKPLILVIDDEPKITDMIARMINGTGRYEAVKALSAKAGFEMLDKHKRFLGLVNNEIECIVLDIKMPEMDGLQFLKQLRQEESWWKLMPVILLTAYEDREKWAKATSAISGLVVEYLKKPVVEEILIDTIDRVFHGEIGYMIDETRENKYRKFRQFEEEEKRKAEEERQS